MQKDPLNAAQVRNSTSWRSYMYAAPRPLPEFWPSSRQCSDEVYNCSNGPVLSTRYTPRHFAMYGLHRCLPDATASLLRLLGRRLYWCGCWHLQRTWPLSVADGCSVGCESRELSISPPLYFKHIPLANLLKEGKKERHAEWCSHADTHKW